MAVSVERAAGEGIFEAAWSSTYRPSDEQMLIAGLGTMGLRLATREAALSYSSDEFFSSTHAKIWDAARKLAEDSKLFTPDNFRPLLSRAEMMTFDALCGKPVREVEFRQGLRLVQDARKRRDLLNVVKQIAVAAQTRGEYSGVLSDAHEWLSQLEGGEVATTSVTLTEALTEFWDDYENPREEGEKFPTPWPTLNRTYLRGGHGRGQLVTWMAVSGGGKSIAMLQTAAKFIRDGLSGAVFSLEMNREDITNRLLSSASFVNIGRIADRDLDEIQGEKVVAASDALNTDKVHIFDATDMTMRDIRQQCAILKRTSGLDFVVVDYIQRVAPEDEDGNREQQVAAIVRQMKNLALSLNVVVLTASQMNEAGERPGKGSARESRAIIHESDLVLALHHGGEGEVDIVVVKNRRGPEADGLLMMWHPNYNSIVDPAAET